MINIFKIVLFIISTILLVISEKTILRNYDCPTKFFVTQLFKSCYNVPKIIDLRKHKYDSQILVYQHNSWIDHFILLVVFGKLRFFAKAWKNKFLMSIMINHAVFIDPIKKQNTQKILEALKEFPDNYIAIAPAGNKAPEHDKIGDFSTGAFVPMLPVTPVLIRYSDPKTTWFNHTMKEWAIYQLSNERSNVEVTILEEIPPDANSTPREFADKVNKIMKEYDRNVPAFTMD